MKIEEQLKCNHINHSDRFKTTPKAVIIIKAEQNKTLKATRWIKTSPDSEARGTPYGAHPLASALHQCNQGSSASRPSSAQRPHPQAHQDPMH